MSIIEENLNILISTGLGAITGIIGFFTGTKLKKSKEKLTESSALVEMQAAYNTFTKDFNDKLSSYDKELLEIRKENREQRSDVRDLKKDNFALHKEITLLSKENGQLKIMISDLTLKNEALSFELRKYKRK
jgi:hypothetical protein